MHHDLEEAEVPPLYADPAFDVVGLDGALNLFRYYLEEKRPALRMLYEAAADGGEARWEWVITPYNAGNELKLSERLRERVQAADSAAGALFVYADTLLESLSSALHVLRYGECRGRRPFKGPRFADVLQAAGNFVRHSAEWGARARETRDISLLPAVGQTSVRILGEQLGASAEELIEVLLGRSSRMFALLHSLFGEATNVPQRETFRPFEDLPAAIETTARAMIERVAVELAADDQGPRAI